MSDGQSRRFQKDIISGNPIFGQIDPIKLFESLVNSKALKGNTEIDSRTTADCIHLISKID